MVRVLSAWCLHVLLVSRWSSPGSLKTLDCPLRPDPRIWMHKSTHFCFSSQPGQIGRGCVRKDVRCKDYIAIVRPNGSSLKNINIYTDTLIKELKVIQLLNDLLCNLLFVWLYKQRTLNKYFQGRIYSITTVALLFYLATLLTALRIQERSRLMFPYNISFRLYCIYLSK